MGLLAEIFSGFVRKSLNNSDKRSSYIFYKIVDSTAEFIYTLQCINTNALFQAKIADIVFDIDILHGLHPVQACFIGIEQANYLKKTNPCIAFQKDQNNKFTKYSVFRYGSYCLHYQDRKGNLFFVNEKTGEESIMDPRDIALTKELISEFDAAQAFYIGLVAGLKMNNTTSAKQKIKPPYLRIVK